MGFPQEMGTQDDKMKANFCFDTLSKQDTPLKGL